MLPWLDGWPWRGQPSSQHHFRGSKKCCPENTLIGFLSSCQGSQSSIIELGKCLDFLKDFESFARATAHPALCQAGTSLAEWFRHNWQQRPQLYPIIPAYGEHICQEYPQGAKILEMLIGERLEPLIKNLKPLLDPKRKWQRASALVNAMQALLQSGQFRDKDYDINNWESSDGPKTRYSFEREECNPFDDARLHADPSMMSEGKLRQAIVFLQKHLEESPTSRQIMAKSMEKLCSNFGAGRVAACVAFLESEEGVAAADDV